MALVKHKMTARENESMLHHNINHNINLPIAVSEICDNTVVMMERLMDESWGWEQKYEKAKQNYEKFMVQLARQNYSQVLKQIEEGNGELLSIVWQNSAMIPSKMQEHDDLGDGNTFWCVFSDDGMGYCNGEMPLDNVTYVKESLIHRWEMGWYYGD
jgi:hypothetical protein